MSEVRKVSPGTRARSFASRSMRNCELRPRFMERSSLSEACCSGMSRYLAIFVSRRHHLDELVGEHARVGVVQADPPHVDLHQRLEQLVQLGLAGQVVPVGGEVLRDQVQLLHAAVREALAPRRRCRDGPRALRAAQLGDDAERARVVAALGDLQVRGVRRASS